MQQAVELVNTLLQTLDAEKVNEYDAIDRKSTKLPQYALAFHGGAGNISCNTSNAPQREAVFQTLKHILKSAHNFCELGLRGELSATDIAEKVVSLFENAPEFNAGKGSVFNQSGKHEMEASIMRGTDLKCGAVSLLNNIKNPICAARDIMESTNHIYLAGKGAVQHIAHLLNDPKPSNFYESTKRTATSFEDSEYFFTEKRWNSFQRVKRRNAETSAMETMLSEDEKHTTTKVGSRS